MKLIERLFAAMIILSLAALACNLPSNTAAQPDKKQNQAQVPDFNNAMTLAVQTIQAATQQAQTSAPAPTTAPAATPSTPTVTVSSATNCRTGPGTNYDILLTFQPGATAEVIGKYSPSNYWIIKTPTGGTCWLWGAYATVQGNSAALAEMVPPAAQVVAEAPTQVPSSGSGSKPPTATATSAFHLNPGVLQQNPGIQINPGLAQALAKPSAPASLTVSTTCTYNVFPHTLKVRTDHLSWPSVSLASGYYVYENGSQISKTTGTSINLMATSSTGNVTFGVAAYNSNGTSGTKSTSSHCP